jgi:protease IV
MDTPPPTGPATSPSFPPQPPYVVAEAVLPSPPQPPRRQSRGFGSLLTVFLLLAFGGSLLLNIVLLVADFSFETERRVREKYFSHSRTAANKVAILTIQGVILGSEEGFVKREIDQAIKDKSVKAVVLRVDSPGGTVSGSDYYYHHLAKLAKEREIPIVVSMGSEAASGGYYVSMAVGSNSDSIYAEPTTWTGSIGVIIPHYNLVGLMEHVGVKQDAVTSGPLKGMGAMTKTMTEEERRLFQALVDDGFARFKEVIRQGRPRFQQHPEELDKLATGQIYTADQAKRNGLVDRIGYIEDAVDRAIELAGLDADNVRVVKYQAEFGLFETVLGMQSRRPGFDLASLLDASAPRAFYLSTRLPPMISSQPE